MTPGDWFVICLIILNAGAMVAYAWEGNWNKALYWLSVIGLNVSLLRMR